MSQYNKNGGGIHEGDITYIKYHKKDNVMYIGYDSKYDAVGVVFRGTVSMKNWASNFD